MILPSNGKVLIIDDNINEALPLMKMLSKIETPYMYFSGKSNELPVTPFKGIRVIFLDLRFSTATGDKNVVSNVIQILKKLVHIENGPFILIIWSKHESEFQELLIEEANKNSLYPEFVLPLSKSDYFENETDLTEQFEKYSLDAINKSMGSDVKNKELVEVLSVYLQGIGCFANKNSKADAIERISEKLKEELEKANLFTLFVLWENTIHLAKYKTVNEIYLGMPESLPKEKRLAAMLYFLACYRLEKSIETVGDEQKFNAALDALNELFFYFYRDETIRLAITDIPNLTIPKDDAFKENVSNGKYNKWIMTCTPSKEIVPGNVYEDKRTLFVPHGLMEGELSDETLSKEFLDLEDNKFIFVEISADCDIAQKKRIVSKIIPGILVFEDKYQKLISEKKIKKSIPDYIKDFGVLESNQKNEDGTSKGIRVLFNLNLATYYDLKDINKDEVLFALRKSFVVNLQTELGKIISRQGIGVFK